MTRKEFLKFEFVPDYSRILDPRLVLNAYKTIIANSTNI